MYDKNRNGRKLQPRENHFPYLSLSLSHGLHRSLQTTSPRGMPLAPNVVCYLARRCSSILFHSAVSAFSSLFGQTSAISVTAETNLRARVLKQTQVLSKWCSLLFSLFSNRPPPPTHTQTHLLILFLITTSAHQ